MKMTVQRERSVVRKGDDQSELISVISDAVSRLRYGVVQITIHDGKATQVDVTERRRFA